jgi:hypothetical protein
MTHTKDEALKLAKECGATTYTNRHYPDAKAVTFSPLAWEKFCEQAFAAPPVQKRPQNCGTGYCSCIECVMEPAPVQPVAQDSKEHLKVMMEHSAWEGRLDLSDALANIDEFYATPPAQPAQPAVQETVAHLWECLGRWSAYLVANGDQADCAPPSWLVDAVKKATQPAAQPAVPDAITDIGENPDYRAGWNECRETMLQILKARTS